MRYLRRLILLVARNIVLALILLGAGALAFAHPGGGGGGSGGHGGGYGGGHGGGHGASMARGGGWGAHPGGWGGGYHGGWGGHGDWGGRGRWGGYGYFPYYALGWNDALFEPSWDFYPGGGYAADDVAPALPPAPVYWYYCGASRTYYPYVRECATAWQRVVPTPG